MNIRELAGKRGIRTGTSMILVAGVLTGCGVSTKGTAPISADKDKSPDAASSSPTSGLNQNQAPSAPPAAPSPDASRKAARVLVSGMTGGDVLSLQRNLVNLGCDVHDPIDPQGNFGPKTTLAVVQFKSNIATVDKQIGTDGPSLEAVGPYTSALIAKALRSGVNDCYNSIAVAQKAVNAAPVAP